MNLVFLTFYFMLFSTVVLFAGFYRGISLGLTGSLATSETYFVVIVTESTKTWLEHTNPNLRGHFSHLFAGGVKRENIFYDYCVFFPENLHDAA